METYFLNKDNNYYGYAKNDGYTISVYKFIGLNKAGKKEYKHIKTMSINDYYKFEKENELTIKAIKTSYGDYLKIN